MGRVLSTTSGTPWAWAMAAIASRSATMPSGFDTLSTNTARVWSSIAAAKFCGLARIDELRLPAELREGVGHLGDRAAIEPGARDHVVPGLHQVEEGQELRRVARGGAAGGGTALERRDPRFQDRDRGVGQAAVDVAELLQIEQSCRVVDVVEHVGRGLVDRDRPRAGGRIGLGTGVNRQGLKSVGALAHVRRSLLRPDGAPV